MSEFAARLATSSAAALAVDLILKGTLIACAAFGLRWFLRARTAAVRHWVLTMAVTGMLLVPLAGQWLPAISLSVLPTNAPELAVSAPGPDQPVSPSPAPVESSAVRAPLTPEMSAEDVTVTPPREDVVTSSFPSPSMSEETSEGIPSQTEATPAKAFDWWAALTVGWIVGVVGCCAMLGLGLVGAWSLRRGSTKVTDDLWARLLLETREQLGITRPVELRSHPRLSTAVTWGVFRPVLVIPQAALNWPANRRRMTMLHEGAHIRRFDWPLLMLARLAHALHWFNPLAWLLCRRLHVDREQACDDVVLSGGVIATDYASELVRLAGEMRPLRNLAAIPMAQPSSLEQRVRGILDDGRSRRRLGAVTLLLTVAAGLLLATPLAMLRAAENRPLEIPNNHPEVTSLAAASAESGRKTVEAPTAYDPAKKKRDGIGVLPDEHYGKAVNGLQAAVVLPPKVKRGELTTFFVVVRNISERKIRVSFPRNPDRMGLKPDGTQITYSIQGDRDLRTWEIPPGHQINVPSRKIQFIAPGDLGRKDSLNRVQPGPHHVDAGISGGFKGSRLTKGRWEDVPPAEGSWKGFLRAPAQPFAIVSDKVAFAASPPPELRPGHGLHVEWSRPHARNGNIKGERVKLKQGLTLWLAWKGDAHWLEDTRYYNRTAYWGPISVKRLDAIGLLEPIRTATAQLGRTASAGYMISTRVRAFIRLPSKPLAKIGLELAPSVRRIRTGARIVPDQTLRAVRDRRVELQALGLGDLAAKVTKQLSADAPPLPPDSEFKIITDKVVPAGLTRSSWGPVNDGLSAAALMPDSIRIGETASARLFIRNASDHDIRLTVANRSGYDYATATNLIRNPIPSWRPMVYPGVIAGGAYPEYDPGTFTMNPPTTTLTKLLLRPGAVWELKTKTGLHVRRDKSTGSFSVPEAGKMAVTRLQSARDVALVTWHLHTANGAIHSSDLRRRLWPAKGGWSGILRTAPRQVVIQDAGDATKSDTKKSGTKKSDTKKQPGKSKKKRSGTFAFRASLRVLDAKTKEAIKSFQVVPTPFNERAKTVTWQSQYRQTYQDKLAVFTMKRGWKQTSLRVDAKGYLPFIIGPLDKRNDHQVEVLMQPDDGIRGRVVDPDGKPVAGATLAVCTWTNEVTVGGKALKYGHHGERLRGLSNTATDGSFQLPAEVDPWVLVVAHDSGFAEPTAAELAKDGTVKLKPWGRIEGVYAPSGEPAADQIINISAGRGDVDVVLHYSVPQILTDKEGKFVAQGLPPVRVFVAPMFRSGNNHYGIFWSSGLVQVEPGKTTKISLPRPGQTITGSLDFPEDSEFSLDNTDVEMSIYLRPPRSFGFGRTGSNGAQTAYAAFMGGPHAKAYRKNKIGLDKEGKFRIEGLAESHYILRALVYAKTKPGEERGEVVASFVTRVPLGVKEEGKMTQDLGEKFFAVRPKKK